MAVNYWTGNTDGDWATAGNWTDGVPSDADTVIFDGRGNAASAIVDVITGTNTHGGTFPLLHVKKSYTGNIGLDGEEIKVRGNKFIFEGSGTMFLECSEVDDQADSAIDLLIVNGDGTLNISSNLNSATKSSVFTEIIGLKGTLNILDTSIVGTLRMSPRNGKAANLTVTVGINVFNDQTGDTPMDLFMNSGILTIDSALGDVIMRNGTVNFGTDLVGSPETGLDITSLRHHGGTFNWNPDDSGDDAVITALWMYGGTLTVSKTLNIDRDKSIGSAAGDVYLFEGATLDIANSMGNITITTNAQLWNLGGTLLVDNYSQIALTYDAVTA